GTLYAVTPYIVGVHGYPFHFFNPTPSGLDTLFAGQLRDRDIAVPQVGHPVVALRYLLESYLPYFEGTAADAFRKKTIGELLDAAYKTLRNGELVPAFREEGKLALPSNYRIMGTKA